MLHPHPEQREPQSGRRSHAPPVYLVTTRSYAGRTIFSCLLSGSIVAAEMRRQDRLGATSTLAFAVMPDHLHWLFELRAASLESVVAQVKGRSALGINRRRACAARIWQAGFHLRPIRPHENLRHLGDYVVSNPVRARLVERPQAYPLAYAAWWDRTPGRPTRAGHAGGRRSPVR